MKRFFQRIVANRGQVAHSARKSDEKLRKSNKHVRKVAQTQDIIENLYCALRVVDIEHYEINV